MSLNNSSGEEWQLLGRIMKMDSSSEKEVIKLRKNKI